MSWDGVLTAYDAHLVAAGATLTPKITSVVRGEPTALSTVPVLAYWWGGSRESSTGGNTLTSVNQQEALVTEIYVPGSVRLPNEMRTVEDYLRAAVFAIHARLWGDAHLNGHCIGISGLNEVTPGWAAVSNIIARTATFTTWVDLADVHTIATPVI